MMTNKYTQNKALKCSPKFELKTILHQNSNDRFYTLHTLFTKSLYNALGRT